MPEEIDRCVESVMEDNPSYDESRAYAICWAQKNDGNLSDDITPEDVGRVASEHNLAPECALSLLADDRQLDDDDPCWEGYTMVGMKEENGREVPNCVPDDEVPDANMSAVAGDGPVVVRQLRDMGSEPIERVEESSDTVRYRNMRLLAPGIWTDEASQTPTKYDEQGMENIEAEYDSRRDGPPINVQHDLAENGEHSESSIAGHVDPDSLTVAEDGLYGDYVLDLSSGAGQFVDESIQEALETNGEKGFGGPSVELELESDQIEQLSNGVERITGGKLTGVGHVRDPASKEVDLQNEAQRRPVAMSNGDTAFMLQQEQAHMSEVADIRDRLEDLGVETDEYDDEDLLDMAQSLHDDLMGMMEDIEMADGEDDDEDDEDDMPDAMQQTDEELEALMEQVSTLEARVEELEDAASDMLTNEDANDLKEDLAAAETVEEIEQRLSQIEQQPKESKTLSDAANDVGEDFEFEESYRDYDEARRSF